MSKIKSVWILGAGKFGCLSWKKLSSKAGDIKITVIDHRPEKLSLITGRTICQDGISFLVEKLEKADQWPDLIIPAIPVHVAYEYILAGSKDTHIIKTMPVPDQLIEKLPNSIKGDSGQAYISNADFLCPDNCPEPAKLCTYTGKPRPRELFDYLAKLNYLNYQSIVLRSRQLVPGVGGYSPKALLDVKNMVIKNKAPVLLSTACRCHGVMHVLQCREKPISK